MKARTGSIVKRKPRGKGARASWWARVTYIDPKTGKRHDLQRRGQSKAHARDLLQALLRDIDATDGQAPQNERKTFAELCDYFEKHYVKAAEYVDGRKVAGVRSLGTAQGQLKVLRDYFGSCRLRSAGDSLISLADENRRERILTREEEMKLLASCDAPQRAHLKSDLNSATRLVGAHIPLSEVGRVLGHSQANTTYRYVNANVETAKRAAAALDAFNAETTEATPPAELVH